MITQLALKSFNNDDGIMFVLNRCLVAHNSKWLERNRMKICDFEPNNLSKFKPVMLKLFNKIPNNCITSYSSVSIQRWPYTFIYKMTYFDFEKCII